jgi:hypothetical protein
MPARDACEPIVIRALAKDGWVVKTHHFPIRFEEDTRDFVFADLRLEQVDSKATIIVAEVKCFPNNWIDEFYRAVGQYLIYREGLILNKITAPIYLVIPHDVFEQFFKKPIIQAVIGSVAVKLILIDLEQEEVIRWVH